jgi:uncharacterized protein (DUF488 family)
MHFDIFSIGHSTHGPEAFRRLLANAGVQAVADVRSSPYSRHFPHFSQDELRRWLRDAGIDYSFLGRELGGRPADPSLFAEGVADYEAMARTPAFEAGVERLRGGASKFRIAMMCSEKEPLDCHRCLLVSRRLAALGWHIGHITPSGQVESHGIIEERLLSLEGRSDEDLFASRAERLNAAYRLRGRKVAYAETLPVAVAS